MINLKSSFVLKLAFFCGWAVILLCILVVGWTSTWKAINVPTVSPPFGDMRSVQGSVYSFSQGFNPQINNPGDPRNTRMNYPLVWASIAKTLRLQSEFNYLVFVITGIGVFLLCCYLIICSAPSTWTLAFVFSGATLLAVERGNNDIIIFSLLYFAACYPIILGIPLMLIAILLKIYPVLALPAFVQNKKIFWALMTGSFLSIIYMLPEFSAIRSGTPISYSSSYGSSSIAAAVQQHLGIEFSSIAISFVLVLVSIIGGCLTNANKSLLLKSFNKKIDALFVVGSCIYVGTFLLSSNWDYRLVFLLFCVPYLLGLENKIMRYVSLVGILLSMNLMSLNAMLGKLGTGLNILSKTVLFVLLCAMLVNTLRNMPKSDTWLARIKARRAGV